MFTGRKLPITLAFGVLLGLAFGVSCKGFFVDPVLTSIAVGPTGLTLQVNDTQPMSARGTYDQGPPKNITGSVLWSSDHPEFAKIDKNGVVTAVQAPGSATISASLDTVTGTTTVNVVLTGVTAITISPKNPNVKQGGSQNFTCTATVSGQQPVDITATVNWSTSDTTNTDITNGENPAVFTVNSGTLPEPVTVTATYTVDSTTFTDTTTVNVTP